MKLQYGKFFLGFVLSLVICLYPLITYTNEVEEDIILSSIDFKLLPTGCWYRKTVEDNIVTEIWLIPNGSIYYVITNINNDNIDRRGLIKPDIFFNNDIKLLIDNK